MRKFFLNPNEMVTSPRQGIKIYLLSLVVDKSKLGVFYCWFRRCRFASRKQYACKSLGLGKQACYLTSIRVEKRPFCMRITAEVRSNFSFSLGWTLFRVCVTPTSYLELLEISALLDLLLSSFYFYFSCHYKYNLSWEIFFFCLVKYLV